MIVYQQPLYYEIAFSFIKAKEQVDNFEKIITKFSEIEVKRFLDIACGPSLQLREIARRGYESIGLDSSSQMLRYLEKKAKEEGVKVETVKADMTNFKLKDKADFAFIVMGSLNVESNEKFLSHAPEEVIAKERAKVAEAEKLLHKIEEAITRMEEVDRV